MVRPGAEDRNMAEIHWSTRGLRIRCREHGFSVAGEGFYVWDERLPAALEKASLLCVHGTAAATPTAQPTGGLATRAPDSSPIA
jgi:hypothetical protein